MQRTRDWRRHQFLKRRKRQLDFVSARFDYTAYNLTREDRREEIADELRKGGFRHSYFPYWLRDEWWFESNRKHRLRYLLPLDKELEAWYDKDMFIRTQQTQFKIRKWVK